MKLPSLNKQSLSASLLLLVAINIAVIIVAIAESWSLGTIVWTYWLQSIIIGLFQALKMLTLKEFSTDGVRINNQPVSPTIATKIRMTIFFIIHFGFFHLVYAGFLSGLAEAAEWRTVCLAGLSFFANHLFSYFENRSIDKTKRPNIGRLMIFPYARIIPMHLIIMFGALLAPHATATLIVFLLLKTVADALMHIVEHAEIQTTSHSSG